MKKADQPIVDNIVRALTTNDLAVERAILILGDRQTTDEQVHRDVRVRNNMGFSKAHANFGMWAYNVIRSGRHLYGDKLEKARKFALHYARTQLLEAAKEKAAKQASKQ